MLKINLIQSQLKPKPKTLKFKSSLYQYLKKIQNIFLKQGNQHCLLLNNIIYSVIYIHIVQYNNIFKKIIFHKYINECIVTLRRSIPEESI